MAEKKIGPGAGDTIVDFDKLVPPSRWARLGGELVDVARIPTQVTLNIIRLKSDADKAEKDGDIEKSEAVFMQLLGILAMVCVESNPKITVDFLVKRTTMQQISALAAFIVQGASGANPPTAKPEQLSLAGS
jgi:hypothetical protein